MAVVTKTLGKKDDGAIRVEADYDDVTEVIQALRWSNATNKPVVIRMNRTDNGNAVIAALPLAPGQSGSRNLPNNQRFRLDQYSLSL